MSGKGALTQNGLFYRAAEDYRNGVAAAERIRVYEKVRQGIWVYTGCSASQTPGCKRPTDGRYASSKLSLVTGTDEPDEEGPQDLEHSRVIPTSVRLGVWRRDKGRCVECGSTDNLHFDHIIPYSKGGSSLTADNIQLHCARHNLEKRDRVG